MPPYFKLSVGLLHCGTGLGGMNDITQMGLTRLMHLTNCYSIPCSCSGVYRPTEGVIFTLWWSSSPRSCPSVCLRQCGLPSRPGWLWCCSLLGPWSETRQRLAQTASLIFKRSRDILLFVSVLADGNTTVCNSHKLTPTNQTTMQNFTNHLSLVLLSTNVCTLYQL